LADVIPPPHDGGAGGGVEIENATWKMHRVVEERWKGKVKYKLGGKRVKEMQIGKI
jgi:hypothetical protein